MTEEQSAAPRRRRKASTGSAFLTVSSAEVIAQGAALVRSIIVVRVIGTEQLGIAMTMLMLGEFLNKMMNLNPGITLVQDKWGGSRKFRHTLQSVLLLRGLIYSALIFLLAWPISLLFSQNQYVIGFMAVALLPLLAGFIHVDVYRQLRNRNYVPVALFTSIPKLVSLGATAILSLWLQTFWLPLVTRAIGSLTSILVSARVARRRFGLAFEKADLIRIIKFIIPLAGAGIILWCNMAGPQALLAAAPKLFNAIQFTMVDVGIWAISMLLCNLPSAIGSRIVSQTWSPQLARLRNDQSRFRVVFREMQTLSYTLAAAVIVLLGAGPTWVPIIFGEERAAAGPIVVVLSVLGGMRLGRVAMRSAALATGRSNIIFYANVAGLIGIVGAAIAILSSGSLVTIALCIILGEICSLLVGNILLARGSLSLSVRDLWLRPVLLCGAAIVIAYLERQLLLHLPLYLGAAVSLALTAGVIGVMAIFNSNIRQFIRTTRSPSKH